MSRASANTLPLELRGLLAELSSVQVAESQRWIVNLMRGQGPAVVTMLWRLLQSEADVLDSYQTTICRLTALGAEAIKINKNGYFYRTAMNVAMELLRQRKLEREHRPRLLELRRRQADRQASFCLVDQREMVQRLRQCIYRLPPHLRDVVILRDLAELPYLRVAAILNIKSGTARLYRRQAILRLADLIGQGVN
ncbi:MAG: sigma-70 family RNA polymerase sigma factor [Phycisphaerales bacterium]|nr:sigma-70 family RNA polymerase sigma factor [Phycisphaerales bacterium]